MNENFIQPSDNAFDIAASFLRRADQPASAAKAAELSDPPDSVPPRDQRLYEPERWDGLS